MTSLEPSGDFGLSFHHVGLAVPDPTIARLFLRGQGYSLAAAIRDPLQHADLAMWEHATAPPVEVISPASPGEGPVAAILETSPGGLIYHLCYTTQDLERALDSIEACGLRPFEVSPPKPAVLFGGEHVSFYKLLGIGLIEIIEGSGRWRAS
jgi:catechol 2,3-dioxygenase-like lactoylglutathione lyase family enzyme